jgi:hypothetical protein
MILDFRDDVCRICACAASLCGYGVVVGQCSSKCVSGAAGCRDLCCRPARLISTTPGLHFPVLPLISNLAVISKQVCALLTIHHVLSACAVQLCGAASGTRQWRTWEGWGLSEDSWDSLVIISSTSHSHFFPAFLDPYR